MSNHRSHDSQRGYDSHRGHDSHLGNDSRDSGVSTPDPTKPRKVIYEVIVWRAFSWQTVINIVMGCECEATTTPSSRSPRNLHQMTSAEISKFCGLAASWPISVNRTRWSQNVEFTDLSICCQGGIFSSFHWCRPMGYFLRNASSDEKRLRMSVGISRHLMCELVVTFTFLQYVLTWIVLLWWP